MAHQVKEITAKPDDLSSNPRTQIVNKRTNSCKLFSDLHKFAKADARPQNT